MVVTVLSALLRLKIRGPFPVLLSFLHFSYYDAEEMAFQTSLILTHYSYFFLRNFLSIFLLDKLQLSFRPQIRHERLRIRL